MFHCNGWCFPWAVTAAAATHVCLAEDRARPGVAADPGGEASRTSALKGAPTVLLSMLAYAPRRRAASPATCRCEGSRRAGRRRRRRSCGGGWASSASDVTHLYGLTETFGPAMICDWRPSGTAWTVKRAAKLKARQGVGNMIAFTPRVIAADGSDVPADGTRGGADRAARQQRDARVPEGPRGDAGGCARRLVPHG